MFFGEFANGFNQSDLQVDTHRDCEDAYHPVGVELILKRPDDRKAERKNGNIQ